MPFEQLSGRNRAIGAAGAIAVNALLVAALLSLSTGIEPPRSVPGLVSFDVSRPPSPKPPQPASKPLGASAPPSRGAARPPSPPKPPHPLPSPAPARASVDVGSQLESGAGAAPGTGTGVGGAGTGGGAATLPVHIAGALTNADYARTPHPRGAEGTVSIAFRVRSDGSVDHCRVTSSSGYPAIDAATCRLVEQRFRFRPALDAAGQPIDFTLRTDFTWEPR